MEYEIRESDVKICNDSAKESLVKIVECMQQDVLHTVCIVTMRNLTKNREYMTQYDFLFAGEREVLSAEGVADLKRLKEVQDMLLLKLFFQYLHKNKKRVFLISDNVETLESAETFLGETYAGICIVDSAVAEAESVSDEKIVNSINGVESDCVLSFMDSPFQEEFLGRNRLLIDNRAWISLGRELHGRINKRGLFAHLKKLSGAFWKKGNKNS